MVPYYSKAVYQKLKSFYVHSHVFHGGNSNWTIDFITKDGLSIVMEPNVFSEMIVKYIAGKDKVVFLDYHGVTDLYDEKETIPTRLDKVIISYVGGKAETLKNTRKAILNRVVSGEVFLGIIVYKKNKEPVQGTKGWVLQQVTSLIKDIIVFFVDDSRTNITCVRNVRSNKIKTFLINKRSDVDCRVQLDHVLHIIDL